MPDIITHARMGRTVQKSLDIQLNEGIYRFGLMGPDPYLFNIPPYYKYSSVMHRKHTGLFLLELAKRCRGRDEFSYLAGFLCHYALDSLTHPYVISKAQEAAKKPGHVKFLHIAIEHRLDTECGESMEIPDFLPDSFEGYVGAAVRKVYGWENAWKVLKFSYHQIHPFYALVRDRFGVLNGLTGWTRSPAAMFSYKSRVCDGLDLSGFWPLFDQACEDAVRYIRCAERFVKGECGAEEFSAVIGDKPYI